MIYFIVQCRKGNRDYFTSIQPISWITHIISEQIHFRFEIVAIFKIKPKNRISEPSIITTEWI